MKLSVIAFAAALCASTAAAAVAPAMKSMPVWRKKGPQYGSGHSKNRNNRAGVFQAKGESTLTLHDDQDFLYFCELDIGTPSQKVFVDIDTGSSDLWFTSSLPQHPCDNCTGPKAFDATKSKTFVELGTPFQIQYLDTTEAVGFVSVETVSLAGMPIQSQTFGAIMLTNATGNNYNGLMGLAQISLSTGTIPVFYNLWNQKLVMSPYFGIFLPHFNNGNNNGGALTMGGVDSQFFTGSIKYYPVKSPFYYEIDMGAVSVDGKMLGLPKGSAIIDSGTSLVYAPHNVWRKLFDGHPGLTLCADTDPLCGGFYKFNCNNPPSMKLSLFFTNDKHDLNPADLNGGPIQPNSTDCLFAIGDYGKGTTQWLVGDSFMRNYYISFSPIKKQVGFAKLKKGGVYF